MKAKIFTFVRGLKNGTPPRFQSYLKSLILLVAVVMSVNVWGASYSLSGSEFGTSAVSSYADGPATLTGADGGEWKVAGYGVTANTSVIIGKSGANYLETPLCSGNITSVVVSWSGNTSYYLALQTTSGLELEAKQNTSGQTYTFNVTGNYTQLRLVGRRSGSGNAAATITAVTVNYSSAPIQKYNLTYHVGSASTTIQVNSGTKLSTALKDVTTTSCDDYSTTFMGWSTAPITGKIQSAPEELLDEDATVTEDMEVWAVWAKKTDKGTKTTTLTLNAGTKTSPFTNNGAVWTFSNLTFVSSGNNSKFNNNASVSCKLPIGATANTFTITKSNTWSSSGISITLKGDGISNTLKTFTSDGSYTFTNADNAAGTYTLSVTLSGTSKNAWTKSISINYNDVSYSDYLTTCCTSWTAPTLTYTASASIGANLSPSWGDGTTHGTLTYSSSDKDILEVNASTGVVTTKAAGTAHVIASWSSTDGYCDNSTISNDITVIAAYNITYKDKGGADFSGNHESGYPKTHTYGTATTLKGASKDYYKFEGWFANESCTGNAIQTVAADAYTADFTLYAKWTPIEYNINYTLNGGTNASGNPAKYTYETETITLQAPSKIGHDFQGWFKESTFENEVITIAKGSHGNVDLYANWSVKSYTLTWDLNGGSVKTAGTTAGSVAFGTALTAPTVERTGYDFTGWKKGGVSVDFTQTVTMPAENATYVAQWTPQVYTISYQDKGGVAFSGSNLGSLPKKHTYNAETQLTDGVKTGYHFDGWFGNSECTGSAMSSVPANTYSQDFTLYAKWTINSYTLTWNLNDGTVTEEGTPAGSVVYATELKAPELEKTGYTYTWNPTVPATMPAADATYSAIWTANVYNITYLDKGGATFTGTHDADYPKQHTYGTATNLDSPTKAHFDFVGWYLTSDCSGEPLTNLAADGYLDNITLYAKWNEHAKYTVTFVDDVQGTNCSAWNLNNEYINTQIVFHSISDAERKAPDGDCVTDHYHFVGWVEDGTIPTKEPDNVIKAGTNTIKVTKDVTYKAVWAKEL